VSAEAFIRAHAQALGGDVPRHSIPILCISYDRRRYVCPYTGSRVALDSGIHADRANGQWIPSVAVGRLSHTVCEFKNQGGPPPPWVHALYCAGFRLRSYSKYGACMAQLLEGRMQE
jgi:hypothetical protein